MPYSDALGAFAAALSPLPNGIVAREFERCGTGLDSSFEPLRGVLPDCPLCWLDKDDASGERDNVEGCAMCDAD